jgi:hypothetical protein
MNAEIKKQWIEALQIGKMPQESTLLHALMEHLQQPEERWTFGLSKQDLLDAAYDIEVVGKLKKQANMMRALIDEVESLQEVTEDQVVRITFPLCHVPSLGCAYFILGDMLGYVAQLANGGLDRDEAGQLNWSAVTELEEQYRTKIIKIIKLLGGNPDTILPGITFV